MAYDWPGNIRELENVLERAIIAMPDSDSTIHLLEALTPEACHPLADAPTNLMIVVERAHILRMLHTSAWRIEGPRGAAVALGLKPSTLRSLMRKLHIMRVRVKRRTAMADHVA
jgi:formate hydrogenlyase transcriptional activator